jgi:hypothetical protein
VGSDHSPAAGGNFEPCLRSPIPRQRASQSQFEIERRRAGSGRRDHRQIGTSAGANCGRALKIFMSGSVGVQPSSPPSYVSDSPIPPSSSTSTRLRACSCGTRSDHQAAIAGPRELEMAHARSTWTRWNARSALPCQSLRRMLAPWIDL